MKKTILMTMLILITSLVSKKLLAQDTRDAALAKISARMADPNDWVKRIAQSLVGGGPTQTSNSKNEHAWFWPAQGDRSFFFYIPKTNKVWLVNGAIRLEWERCGNEGGILGLPTTDATPTKNGGLVQGFDFGNIFFTPQKKAIAINGAIVSEYISQGSQNGWLGYPTDIIHPCPDGKGLYEGFEHGMLYKIAGSNVAFPVGGAFLDYWSKLGYEKSALGFPVSREIKVETGGVMQLFQQGTLYWTPGGGVTDYPQNGNAVAVKAHIVTAAGNPLSGDVTAVLYKSGNYTLISNLHSSAVTAYSYEMKIVIMGPSRMYPAITLAYKGDMQGTTSNAFGLGGAPRRDDNKVQKGHSTDLVKYWRAFQLAKLHWQLNSGLEVVRDMGDAFESGFDEYGKFILNYITANAALYNGTIVMCRRDDKTGELLTMAEYNYRYPHAYDHF